MQKHKKEIYKKYIKRCLDFVLALTALVVLSPVMLITAILVRIKLGSPVLFRQQRPGKDEKIFDMYKFRSMSNAKDENGKMLPDEKRLTSFGRKLRATSLDELPELINIIRGDMSIVGPRPLAIAYLPYYSDAEKHRHDVLPGLTGLAQVNGRTALNWDKRLEYDIEYIKHISLKLDIKIICLTIKKVFAKTDIVEPGSQGDFHTYRICQLKENELNAAGNRE